MSNLFSSEAIAPGVTRIVDVIGNHAYLLEGREQALLVDSCGGFGDIRAYVAELTQLPVEVALTHGHYDHVSGAYWYGQAYMAEVELGARERAEHDAREVHRQLIDEGVLQADAPFSLDECAAPEIRVIAEGAQFDLGGLTVEVYALPGHTQGSLGYLVKEHKILLTGDAVTPVMTLYFDESSSIDGWIDTLRKMQGLPFEHFYTGHHDFAFEKSSLESFIAAAEFAKTDRGIEWEHARIASDRGIVHLCPSESLDADSPDFRAVIEKWHELPPRVRKRRRTGLATFK